MQILARYTTLLLMTLAAQACGSSDPTVTASASPASFGSGQSTTLTVEVDAFELRDPAAAHTLTGADTHQQSDSEGGVTADGGHYHVYLDSTDVNPLKMAWTPSLELTVTATPGAHTLIIRLNADDHRFLVPEIKSTIDITIE